uniref:Uncharacterized protein n=1 Tax=Odontella aurita TaxID=265563 RepID=A0A7S4I5D4_9STRA
MDILIHTALLHSLSQCAIGGPRGDSLTAHYCLQCILLNYLALRINIFASSYVRWFSRLTLRRLVSSRLCFKSSGLLIAAYITLHFRSTQQKEKPQKIRGVYYKEYMYKITF